MAGRRSEFNLAADRYRDLGVDVEGSMTRLSKIEISLPCWQGDDVRGFEQFQSELGGGLAVTGGYPGRARNARELRDDVGFALTLIPGKHRLSLHASYADVDAPIERDRLEPKHFSSWIEWARSNRVKLDFNPTFFAHPLAASGTTLAHRDPTIRDFWVEHGIRSRRIGEAFGRELGATCITNFWMPDGSKDQPIDRKGPRDRLKQSLDRIFADPIDAAHNKDSLESKLFGIGSESYVVGSHEFCLGYAIGSRKVLCMDTGHFHPTELVSDKLSAVFTSVDEVLLHLSRGVRWDSDHVVIASDELLAIAEELVRGDYLRRTHIGLDFFDASINRIAAWVIGARTVLKTLLRAFLEPTTLLLELEAAGDFTGRLAAVEAIRSLPYGLIWDHYCETMGVPTEWKWLETIRTYEREVLSKR